MRTITGILAIFLLGLAAPGAADEPRTLDELLQQVREARTEAAAIHRDRERRFIAARDQQRQLLQQARRDHEREEQRSETLQVRFDEHEREITELEETLRVRMGHLGELHGVVRQVSGDLQGVIRNSIVSAQYPGRSEQVARLAEGR
jgi:biopolymer transport protein ExbB